MTRLEKIRKELAKPELAKFKIYYYNHILTHDELNKVLSKHHNFRRFYRLSRTESRIVMRALMKGMEAGFQPNIKGTALKVESLETTLKHVTFNTNHLNLGSS